MKFRVLKNRFISDFSYNKRKISISSFPNIHSIEITNHCNLDCIMCPRKYMARKKGFMNFSLFRKTIDECKKYLDFVYLHHMGEALLHPKVIEMIDYCRESGVKMGISTNATLLNEELSKRIIKSKLDQIYFSIDGATKETFERIRKNADFERTMQNINNFLKLKGKSHSKKPFSGIKIILMNETKDEVSKFLNRWKDEGLDSIEVKYFNSWAGQLKETKILTRPEHCIANHIARDKKRQPCKWFWHNLVILWDGTVVPCCRDYDAKLALGNIAEESLRDIWNNEKMLKLRSAQAKLNFENGLCGTCPEWVGSRSNPFYPMDMSLYRGLKEYFGKIGIFKTGIDISSKQYDK